MLIRITRGGGQENPKTGGRQSKIGEFSLVSFLRIKYTTIITKKVVPLLKMKHPVLIYRMFHLSLYQLTLHGKLISDIQGVLEIIVQSLTTNSLPNSKAI